MKIVVWRAALFALGFLAPAMAAASEFERPPVFEARAILGAAAVGANYRVADRVTSDGYLRNYEITTAFGQFSARGDQMLKMRVHELDTLAALEKLSQSQTFVDALAKAGLGPVYLAGKLVASPGETLKDTLSGAGQALGGFASGLRNAGRSQDSFIDSVTGAAKQRRLIAYRYGVDPYTDFAPLAQALDALSHAAAAGGLTISAAFAIIPGGAGMVVSGASTANTVNGLAVENSASQLADIARVKLFDLGVDSQTTERMLANAALTPVDAVAVAEALAKLGKLPGVDGLAAWAAQSRDRDEAIFARRSLELMAADQLGAAKIVGFARYDDARWPIATTADNGLIGVAAVDCLAWTKEVATNFAAIEAAARADGAVGRKTLSITGTATALAKKKLAAQGWAVRENAGARK